MTVRLDNLIYIYMYIDCKIEIFENNSEFGKSGQIVVTRIGKRTFVIYR